MSYIQWIRNLVGHRKIFLAFSSVVLHDEQGKVLLQRRTDFAVWGLPGGILEPGENILDCAYRELQEETGLTAGRMRLVGVYTDPRYDSVYPNGDQVQQYTVCFQGRVSGGQMKVDGVETSEQAFFKPEDIPFDEMPIFYQAMLRDALRGGEPVFLPPYTRQDPVNQIDNIRPLIGKALYIGVGAIAVTLRHDGRILMVKRTDNGEWSLPGGYMHLGENVAHAAVREIQEETGLQVVLERILGISSPTTTWVYPNGDQAQAVITVFRARPVGGEMRPDHKETSHVAWMTPEEVLALDSHPTLARLNRAVVEHLDGGTFVV